MLLRTNATTTGQGSRLGLVCLWARARRSFQESSAMCASTLYLLSSEYVLAWCAELNPRGTVAWPRCGLVLSAQSVLLDYNQLLVGNATEREHSALGLDTCAYCPPPNSEHAHRCDILLRCRRGFRETHGRRVHELLHHVIDLARKLMCSRSVNLSHSCSKHNDLARKLKCCTATTLLQISTKCDVS